MFGKGFGNKYAQYLIMVLSLSFLAYYIFKSRIKLNTTHNVLLQEDDLLQQEQHSTQSLGDLLLKEEQQNKFQNAIRIRFLMLLNKLEEKKHIVFKVGKTNTEYSKEIKNDVIRQKFDQLSHIFDWYWYGNFEVSEGEYASIKNAFEQENDFVEKYPGHED